MNKNKIFKILGILMIVIAAIFAFINSGVGNKKITVAGPNVYSANLSNAASSSQSQIPSVDQVVVGRYPLVEVAKHNNAVSCWSAINGSVYDLTSWIAQHPGGEGTILSICGKDGSGAFNNQHGGQGKPERILETYKIGTLGR